MKNKAEAKSFVLVTNLVENQPREETLKAGGKDIFKLGRDVASKYKSSKSLGECKFLEDMKLSNSPVTKLSKGTREPGNRQSKKYNLIRHLSETPEKSHHIEEEFADLIQPIHYMYKFENDSEFYNAFVKKFYGDFKVEKTSKFSIIREETIPGMDKLKKYTDVSHESIFK